MRIWLLLALLLTSCNSSVTPNRTPSQPTLTAAVTRETITDVPAAPTHVSDVPRTPDIVYRAQITTSSLERITNDGAQIVAREIGARMVVANRDHKRLAVRTIDDTTILIDVATAQQYGPFDACDSMTWAVDNATLWCMRFGHLYTIETPTQTDQLSVASTGDTYWAELTQHPVTQDYWMRVVDNTQEKLCQFDTTTQALDTDCISTGQMPRWSPDGQLLASIADQRLVITDANSHMVANVGLGDIAVTQLTWINEAQLAINTHTNHYGYQINDARISLQASDFIIIGR